MPDKIPETRLILMAKSNTIKLEPYRLFLCRVKCTWHPLSIQTNMSQLWQLQQNKGGHIDFAKTGEKSMTESYEFRLTRPVSRHYANCTCADQTAHMHSLICAWAARERSEIVVSANHACPSVREGAIRVYIKIYSAAMRVNNSLIVSHNWNLHKQQGSSPSHT